MIAVLFLYFDSFLPVNHGPLRNARLALRVADLSHNAGADMPPDLKFADRSGKSVTFQPLLRGRHKRSDREIMR
jgi:hypothetical protein